MGASDNRSTTDQASNANEEWSTATELSRPPESSRIRLGSKVSNGRGCGKSRRNFTDQSTPLGASCSREIADGTSSTIPPCGYLWLDRDSTNAQSSARKGKPVVKFNRRCPLERSLRGRFSSADGRDRRIRRHEQRENRLSLQLARAFRASGLFALGRTLTTKSSKRLTRRCAQVSYQSSLRRVIPSRFDRWETSLIRRKGNASATTNSM